VVVFTAVLHSGQVLYNGLEDCDEDFEEDRPVEHYVTSCLLIERTVLQLYL